MKTIKLYRPVVGKCINVQDFGPARIGSVDTTGYSSLPGGKGIYECVIHHIPLDVRIAAGATNDLLTDAQLERCERIMKDAEES